MHKSQVSVRLLRCYEYYACLKVQQRWRACVIHWLSLSLSLFTDARTRSREGMRLQWVILFGWRLNFRLSLFLSPSLCLPSLFFRTPTWKYKWCVFWQCKCRLHRFAHTSQQWGWPCSLNMQLISQYAHIHMPEQTVLYVSSESPPYYALLVHCRDMSVCCTHTVFITALCDHRDRWS